MAFTKEELEWLRKENEEDRKWSKEWKPIFEKRRKKKEKIAKAIIFLFPSEITRATLAKIIYDVVEITSNILHSIVRPINTWLEGKIDKHFRKKSLLIILLIIRKPFSHILVDSVFKKYAIAATLKKIFGLETK